MTTTTMNQPISALQIAAGLVLGTLVACSGGHSSERCPDVADTTETSDGDASEPPELSDVPDIDRPDSAEIEDDADVADTAPALERLGPLGGEATVVPEDGLPFASLLRQLPLEQLLAGSRGREFFVGDWEIGDSGRELLNGLGPLLHVSSCLTCHPGSGRPSTYLEAGQIGPGLLLRVQRVGDEGEALGGDPVYGTQLQPFAIPDVAREAEILWSPVGDEAREDAARVIVAGDRTIQVHSENYGPFDAESRVGARLSPHLTGMGLLDHIPDSEILELEDPDDLDGDGISGRANILATADGGAAIGRYGWKANVATLQEQVAFAFSGDMGITSPLAPDERCTSAQLACAESENGGTPEISEAALMDVVEYLRLLGVPERAPLGDADDVEALRLFSEVGCASCHRPTLTTEVFSDDSVLSGQAIHPFTDLLLHDMGPELADGIPDGAAAGSEWRTPPLWGIGRVAESEHARFMHDGRAGTIEEAILWHAGEASTSRARWTALSESSRELLLDFLHTL